jgi:hypothetical protein
MLDTVKYHCQQVRQNKSERSFPGSAATEAVFLQGFGQRGELVRWEDLGRVGRLEGVKPTFPPG